jgi:hypothetical protein
MREGFTSDERAVVGERGRSWRTSDVETFLLVGPLPFVFALWMIRGSTGNGWDLVRGRGKEGGFDDDEEEEKAEAGSFARVRLGRVPDSEVLDFDKLGRGMAVPFCNWTE